MFSSSSFGVSGFKFRSLIHLELVFIQDNRYESNFTLLFVDIQLSQHHLLMVFIFTSLCFWHPDQTSSGWSYMDFCLVLWGCPIGLYGCLFTTTILLSYCASLMHLQVWNGNTSSIVLILRIVLVICGVLWFQINFRIVLWGMRYEFWLGSHWILN